MNRFYILFGFVAWCGLLSSSCSNSVPKSHNWTAAEFQKAVDSAMAIRIPKIKKELWDDFEIKKNIILKSKIDSILGITRAPISVVVPTDTLIDTNYDAEQSNTHHQ